jgi:DNA-directed RNA polymerase subunit RPC12/RpoP
MITWAVCPDHGAVFYVGKVVYVRCPVCGSRLPVAMVKP